MITISVSMHMHRDPWPLEGPPIYCFSNILELNVIQKSVRLCLLLNVERNICKALGSVSGIAEIAAPEY